MDFDNKLEKERKLCRDLALELDMDLPALEAAKKRLNSLKKGDLVEVKSLASPPVAVKKVMDAICLVMGRKQTWTEAKRMLGESSVAVLD